MAIRPPTRIREVRTLIGVSAEELGEMVGMTQSGISRIENGRVSISLDVLYKIADALRVAPGDLLESQAASTTSYAPIRGDLRFFDSRSILHPPFLFVATPRKLDISTPADAFQLSDHQLLYAIARFPRPDDHGHRFIIRYLNDDYGEVLSLRRYEASGDPGASREVNDPMDRLKRALLDGGTSDAKPTVRDRQSPVERLSSAVKTLRGFSTDMGPPPSRWLPAGADSISEVWKVVGEFRQE